MNRIFTFYFPVLLSGLVFSMFESGVYGHPLPGRDRLKFSQAPMIATSIIDNNGTVSVYGGHDELSTAYGFVDPNGVIPIYQGKFMADDFADKLNSPIVHVRWWGSYLNDLINPQMPVDKFLITFETDVPAGPPPSFSHPGQPLLNQVVTRANTLTPGSGTFTESLIRGPDPVVNESLYEYNAELHLGHEFPEMADTVYWLKIVALVDVPQNFPQFNPYDPPNPAIMPITRWGWHNRDYTQQNTLASGNVFPGEQIVGTIGANTPVWHFQDNAIQGDVRIDVMPPFSSTFPDVFQPHVNMLPQYYMDFADGPASSIPGTTGISSFSKDLAFELYTVQIPEPAAGLLMLIGMVAVGCSRRRGQE